MTELVSLPIQPMWAGETVVCIGGGPSLTANDVKYIKGKARVIAINDAYRLAPFADMLYGCDLKWWQWHEGCPGFTGDKWTMSSEAAVQYCLRFIDGKVGHGLSDDRALIHQGQNSGFQAINIAYLAGAARIILLGYDMSISAHGQSHWFGDHPDKIRSNYEPWLIHFQAAADQHKVEIINCSRTTALRCFPIKSIREVL